MKIYKTLKTLLIILIFLSYNSAISQNIYLEGSINDKEVDEIIKIVNSYQNKFKPKIIKLYYSDATHPFFEYKKKDKQKDSKLKIELKKISEMGSKRLNSNEIDDIFNFRSSANIAIPLVYFNKDIRPIPPYRFNKISNVLNTIENSSKKEKKNFLLIYNKISPKIESLSLKDNSQTNNNSLSGKVNSIYTINEVLVRCNSSVWSKADGTLNWTTNLSFKIGNNQIEIITIDKDNDTSDVFRISNVNYSYKTFDKDFYNFISPSFNSNVVQQCLKNKDFGFKFKIGFNEDKINLNNYIFNLIRPNGDFEKINLDKCFPSISNNRSSYLNTYCFLIPYAKINGGASGGYCNFNLEDNYYIQIDYVIDGLVLFSSEKILVHFSSFSADSDKYKQCNCD